MVKKKKLLIGIITMFVMGIMLYNKPISKVINVETKVYGTPANNAFTDENFYKCVVDAYNTQNNVGLGYDVSLTDEQLASITSINCSGDGKEDTDIVRSTNGLNKLVNITKLNLFYNQITSIDLSNNAMLTTIDLRYNNLSSIDVSRNVNLKELYLTANKLTNIDLKNNVNLESLQLGDYYVWTAYSYKGIYRNNYDNNDGNLITKLDLHNNVNIKELWLSDLGLEELIIPENNMIETIYSSNNNLKNFDFLNVLGSSIVTLDLENTGLLSFNNYLFDNLENLILDKNENIAELEIDKYSHLRFLSISGLANLNSLDISNNSELRSLRATDTGLSYIDLNNNTEIDRMWLGLKGFNKIAMDKFERTYDQNVEYTDTINVNLYVGDGYYFGDDFEKISDLSFDTFSATGLHTVTIDKENLIVNMGTGDHNIVISGFVTSDQTWAMKTVKLNYNFSVAGIFIDVFNGTKDVVVDNDDSLFFIKGDGNWVETVNVINGDGHLENNKYIIECNGEVVKVFDLVYINSAKYQINYDDNNENFYIYTGFDSDKNVILSNIEVTAGFETSINDDKLIVKRDGHVVGEFELVSISSDVYNLEQFDSSKKFLTIDNGQDVLSSIDVTNASKELVFMKSGEAVELKIVKNDVCLYSTWLAYASSEKYDLNQESIIVLDNNIDDFIYNFRCINCSFVIIRNGTIKYGGDFADGDSLAIVENNEILKEYNLLFNVTGVDIDMENVNLNLDTKKIYQLSANMMPSYATNKNVTWESSNPSVVTVDENGLLTAKSYGEATITVTTEDGNFTDTCNAVVSEITTYTVTFKDGNDTYTSEFEENEDIVFKTDLLKSGYKLVGWKYNNQDYSLADKLLMPGNDIELDAIWELVIPEVKNYESDDNNITGISLKTSVDNLNLGIGSIYQVKVSTHNGTDKISGFVGTGDKVKVYLNNQLVSEYDVIIKGDVTGTGTSTVSDVAKLYQYMKGKIAIDDCYIKAGNVVDSDNIIKVNDVAKLYQFIKGKINSL